MLEEEKKTVYEKIKDIDWLSVFVIETNRTEHKKKKHTNIQTITTNKQTTKINFSFEFSLDAFHIENLDYQQMVIWKALPEIFNGGWIIFHENC